MSRFDHTAFVNSRRDERSLGHHIDIRMVQALLGHANLKTTEIYVRVPNSALLSALERANVLSLLEE